MKKFISLLFITAVVAVAVSVMPGMAMAYSSTDVKYPVQGGNIYFDKSTGTVTYCEQTVTEAVIPAEIEGISVKAIAANAFAGGYDSPSRLKKVTIPGSVKTIGNYAFQNCSNLNSVTIKKGVKNIGAGAFCDCTALTGITIPEGVGQIKNETFMDCKALTKVVLPSTVKEIGEHAFMRCSKLADITLPEGLEIIAMEAFHNCISLSKIVLPSTLTYIDGRCFAYCDSLKSINVADASETYVSVDGIVYSSDMSEIVMCPPGKTSADIAEGVVRIEAFVFDTCKKLTRIRIPASVEEIGMYVGDDRTLEMLCFGGESITVDSGNKYYKSINGMLYSKDGKKFISCPAKKTEAKVAAGVTEIADYAFMGSKISRLILPESLEKLGQYSISFCDNLVEINIPSRVSNIAEEAICMNYKLRNINVNKNNKYYVSKNGVLYNKKKTKLICCPVAKTGITIPKTVTEIERAFGGSKISELVMPDSVTKLWFNAFGNAEIRKIELSNNLETIEQRLFYNCSKLESITLPIKIRKIEEYAFEGCTSLQSITIPGSVRVIEEGAFRGCDKINIHGVKGSAAYRYALMHRIPFFSVNGYADSIAGDKYGIVVVNEKGKPVKGASVSYGDIVDVTDSRGLAEFDMNYEIENVSISCKGYTSYEFLKKDDNQIDFVIIHSDKNSMLKLKRVMLNGTTNVMIKTGKIAGDDKFSLKCEPAKGSDISRYEIWQGDKKKASSDTGDFRNISAQLETGGGLEIRTFDSRDRYVRTHLNIEIIKQDKLSRETIETGGGKKLMLDKTLPVIGGRTVSVDIPEQMAVKMKTSGENFYIGINIKNFEDMSIKDIKKCMELLKKFNSQKESNSAQKQLQELIKKYAGQTGLGEFNMPVIGIGEGTFDEYGFSTDEIPVYLGASVNSDRHSEWTDNIDNIPVLIKADTTMSDVAAVSGNLSLTTSEFAEDIVFSFAPKTYIKIENAVNGQVEAIGYGTFRHNVKVALAGGYTVDSEIEAWFRAYAGTGLIVDKMWENTYYDVASESYGEYGETEDEMLNISRSNSYYKTSSMYLDNTDTSHSPYSIVDDDSNIIMAYIDTAISEDGRDKTVIKYSVYDKQNKTLKESVLDTDAAGAWAPKLYSVGQDIYLIYQSSTNVSGKDPMSDLSEYIKNQSIYAAKFDNVTKEFANISTVAPADQKYRSGAVIGAIEGNLAAAWILNEDADDVFRQTGDSRICYSIYTDDGWGEAVDTLYTGNIADIAVTPQGIAYVLSTENYRALYIGDSEIDRGSISNVRVCNGILLWTNEGTLKKYDGQDNITILDDVVLSSEFAVDGNSLYYVAESADSYAIYKRNYDIKAGSWSQPVKLAESKGYIERLFVTGNDIYAFTEEDKLEVNNIDSVTDITVKMAEYDSMAMTKEEKTIKIPVNVTIENSGDNRVDALNITVTDEAGSIVYSDNTDVKIDAGEQQVIEIPLVVGEDTGKKPYKINVDADGDRNPEDNSVEVVIGYTDFELTCEQLQVGDARMICMTVKNNSYIPSSGIINIICGEKTTYFEKVPELAYGQSFTSIANLSEIPITDGNSNKVKIEAVADAEEDETYNNYENMYINLDYKITYFAKASDTDSFMVQNRKYSDGAAITDKRPVQEGYKLTGWSTDSNAEEPEYKAGDIVDVNRDLILYGVWEVDTDYMVSGTITSQSDEKAVIKVYDKNTDINKIKQEMAAEDYSSLAYDTDIEVPVKDGNKYTQQYSVTVEDGEYRMAVCIPGYSIYISDINKANTVQNITLCMLGDVDGDDRLGIGDSVIFKRYIAGWDGYESLINNEAADINGDGAIDAIDLTLLERHMAGWYGYEQLEYGMEIPE